jgi:hypothetical protein
MLGKKIIHNSNLKNGFIKYDSSVIDVVTPDTLTARVKVVRKSKYVFDVALHIVKRGFEE